MAIRYRITILFVLLVMFILGLVCGGIYYSSYEGRIAAIKKRLTNRALTTARLLDQKEIFDQYLVRRIDSLTTLTLKNKTVQAYNAQLQKVYAYSDIAGDTLTFSNEKLTDAKTSGPLFFLADDKEAVAFYYSEGATELIVVSAAEDIEGKQNLRSLMNILIVCFLIGTGIVLIVGYVFSTRLILPLKKIAADVEEISAQNLARRIKTGNSPDEWHQLATTFNSLLDRLQDSFELQRRFISNASHELSTPLTSILSQLEVSFQRDREASEYRKTMQSVYQDVRHMSKLTRTLLEFAKASGNQGGLEINLIRIDEVILRLPAEISKANEQYSIQLEFHDLPEDPEELLVFGNEELLFTAIKNIALNACKYSQDHHGILVMNVSNKNISITISDKGFGITEDQLKTIFQPFYRAHENLAGEGFGLGLSLADRIIKLHKGSISVTSELNTGSTFTINLPGANDLR